MVEDRGSSAEEGGGVEGGGLFVLPFGRLRGFRSYGIGVS